MASSPEKETTIISSCMIKAASPPPPQTHHLTPYNLCFLSPHYIQKGFLFSQIPPPFSTKTLIQQLKSSLSVALHHFYPLSGRFQTKTIPTQGLFISIDCSNQGAQFIHAASTAINVEQVFALTHLDSLFPLNHVVNHDGHTEPLLAVQVTELQNGLFLACCFNHAVADGTSYWHFLNAWSEISRFDRGLDFPISRPPVHDKFFIDGRSPPVVLPYPNLDGLIERYTPPPLAEKMFHFSAQSVAKLKAEANSDSFEPGVVISSFQSLTALMWRCITRARGLQSDCRTSCQLAIQDRGRLRPALSPDYFGVMAAVMPTTTTVWELMGNGIGWAGLKLNRAVAAHTDEVIREKLRKYHEKPVVYRLSEFDGCSIMMASSPRFDMYGCDFGWGEALAVRSGPANKFEGSVTAYPGREGGGSVDLEVCLLKEHMDLLQLDQELMDVVDAST